MAPLPDRGPVIQGAASLPSARPVRAERRRKNAVAKYSAQISFRSTPEFKEALEKRAKQEMMSVSTLILKVMEDYLTRAEQDRTP